MRNHKKILRVKHFPKLVFILFRFWWFGIGNFWFNLGGLYVQTVETVKIFDFSFSRAWCFHDSFLGFFRLLFIKSIPVVLYILTKNLKRNFLWVSSNFFKFALLRLWSCIIIPILTLTVFTGDRLWLRKAIVSHIPTKRTQTSFA